MRFFFDNNISQRLVNILKELDVDAIHLKEIFPENTGDSEWIPRAGTEKWIVITADKRIRRNAPEQKALTENNVSALFLKESFLKKRIWQQAEWVIKHWQTIEQEAVRLSQGTCAIVRENGRLDILR